MQRSKLQTTTQELVHAILWKPYGMERLMTLDNYNSLGVLGVMKHQNQFREPNKVLDNHFHRNLANDLRMIKIREQMELERVKKEMMAGTITGITSAVKKPAKLDPNDLSNYKTGAELKFHDQVRNAVDKYYKQNLATPEVDDKGRPQSSKGMIAAFVAQLNADVGNVVDESQSPMDIKKALENAGMKPIMKDISSTS